jgi:septum formation protein
MLASTSPRRRQLLASIGIEFELISVAVEEIPGNAEAPADFAVRMACEKASAGCQAADSLACPVLGADTVVVVDQEIFGKPTDLEDARRMLGALGGRWHQVITAVALADGDRVSHRCQISEVCMVPLDNQAIDAYWATGEPCDKAGAYAIQGLASSFITALKGSYSGVMGLPLYETLELMREFGLTGFENLAVFFAGAARPDGQQVSR